MCVCKIGELSSSKLTRFDVLKYSAFFSLYFVESIRILDYESDLVLCGSGFRIIIHICKKTKNISFS